MRYFGYGSNLHAADLARWCRERGFDPGAIREVGPAWLPDHEPVYHYRSAARRGGALSVRERLGSATPGALFEVDDDGWAALDVKEGAPYRRIERVVLHEGEEVRATTYAVREAYVEGRLIAPQPFYRALVHEGLAARGLPTHQAAAAAERLDIEAFPRALFVYGTLMRGELREPLIRRHAPRRWVDASLPGRLVDLGDYPGMVPGEGLVRGELVELDDPAGALDELDAVEDFLGYGRSGSMYRRVVVTVGDVHAWTYRYLGADGAPITSGDWRRR